MTTVIISLISICAAFYIAICLYMLIFQNRILYIPTNQLSSDPKRIGLDFSEHWVATSDQERLHAWHIPVKDSPYTLLFFHGNTGNISDRMDTIKIFNQLGLSSFMIDYRGYGQSSGTPTEQGTYLDGESAWNYLVNELKTNPAKIIIFGRSLGGGIATELALQHPTTPLILESTFTTLPAQAKDVYPYIPVNMILRTHYSNIDKIRRITCPLLIIHSTEDNYIRYHHGKALFEAYNPDAVQSRNHFVTITGTHNNGFYTSVDKYKQGIKEYLALLACATPEPTENNDSPLTESAQQ